MSPALRRVEAGDVGIIPGGLGYNFGADSQGKAFYVFSPKDGSIINKIALSGMAITPVTYFSSDQKTTEFITGDSAFVNATGLFSVESRRNTGFKDQFFGSAVVSHLRTLPSLSPVINSVVF